MVSWRLLTVRCFLNVHCCSVPRPGRLDLQGRRDLQGRFDLAHILITIDSVAARECGTVANYVVSISDVSRRSLTVLLVH